MIKPDVIKANGDVIELINMSENDILGLIESGMDNYEAYELESPKDYGAVLSLLTGIFNEDWQTNLPETVIDDYMAEYFKQELAA